MRMMFDGFHRPHRLARLARRQRDALAGAAAPRRRSRRSISTVADARVSRSRPETGIVTFKGAVRNAAGVVLCEMVSPIIVRRRDGAGGVGYRCISSRTLEIGARRELGSFTFTADDDQAISPRSSTRRRFHLDEEEGRKSLFGGLAASGWHVASVCMKLLVANGQRRDQGGIGAWRGGRGLGTVAGLSRTALDQAGARRRHHQLLQRRRNQAHIGEASRMGHPAGPQHRHQSARRTGVSRSRRPPSCQAQAECGVPEPRQTNMVSGWSIGFPAADRRFCRNDSFANAF